MLSSWHVGAYVNPEVLQTPQFRDFLWRFHHTDMINYLLKLQLLSHSQRTRGGAESLKFVIMFGLSGDQVPCRSLPRAATLKQEILHCPENSKRFRNSLKGTPMSSITQEMIGLQELCQDSGAEDSIPGIYLLFHRYPASTLKV